MDSRVIREFFKLLKLSAMILVRVEIAGDDHAIRELSPCECVLGLLALHAGTELDEDLSAARYIHARHRTRDLDTAHLSKPTTLLADILQNILVLLLINQFLRHHHVEETEHFGRIRRARANNAGNL